VRPETAGVGLSGPVYIKSTRPCGVKLKLKVLPSNGLLKAPNGKNLDSGSSEYNRECFSD